LPARLPGVREVLPPGDQLPPDRRPPPGGVLSRSAAQGRLRRRRAATRRGGTTAAEEGPAPGAAGPRLGGAAVGPPDPAQPVRRDPPAEPGAGAGAARTAGVSGGEQPAPQDEAGRGVSRAGGRPCPGRLVRLSCKAPWEHGGSAMAT